MKIARFTHDGIVMTGELREDKIIGMIGESCGKEYRRDEARLIAPCSPTKVVAVGLNYRDHAEELDMDVPETPLLFMKPSTSVIGRGESIVIPEASKRVDYEAELAVVIGKTARHVPAADAHDVILGYTCLNDVTARDLQSRDGQWTRAKGFDTFCPIGPWIETELDPSDLSIELLLNGEVKQKSRTSELIFSPAELVEFISGVMTLLPGDVIATGTTSGIGLMTDGDEVEVRIEGIGSLVNRATAE